MRRPPALLGAVLLAGLALAPHASAAAAPAKPAKAYVVDGTSGADIDVPSVQLSGGCPVASATFYAKLYGPGFPADGYLIKTPTAVGMSPGAFTYRLSNSFRDVATNAGVSTLAGDYEVRTSCQEVFGQLTSAGYVATLTFTTPTAYVGPPAPPAPPVVPTANPADPAAAPGAGASTAPVLPTKGKVIGRNAGGDVLGPDPELVPGQVVDLVASGFAPDERLTIHLAEREPATGQPFGERQLSEAKAVADGASAFRYTVSADTLAGSYRLAFRSASQEVTYPYRVLAPEATPLATAPPGGDQAAAGGGGPGSALSGGALGAVGLFIVVALVAGVTSLSSRRRRIA